MRFKAAFMEISIFRKFSRSVVLLTLAAAVFVYGAESKASSRPDSLQTSIKKDSSAQKKDQSITDTVFYESETIDYDAENKTLVLTGKAYVKYQNIVLYADTIHYDIDKSVFTATGYPLLVEDQDTTVGDFMVYNIKTRKGRVRAASTHFNQGYFNGQRIIKTDKNELYVDQGDFTTCSDYESPHYFFYGKNIKVIPNDKIVSRPVVLDIGDAPVAVLPFFMLPMERKRSSGVLTPAWGGNFTGGGYVDNLGYYFAPNDYLDFLARGRVYDFSQFVVEGSSHYALKYKLDGGVSAKYAFSSDFMNQKTQWELNYYHNQNLTPDGLTKLSGKGNMMSSHDISQRNFYQNYSEDTAELREQTLKANMSLSRQFQGINGSANIAWERTHNLRNQYISEDLPSFSFSLPSRPLIPQSENSSAEDPKWFNKIYWGYGTNAVVKHNSYNDSVPESYHPGASQNLELSAPQTFFKYFTVNPRFSAQLSSFYGYIDTTVNGNDTISDTVIYVKTLSSTGDRYPDYKEIHSDTLSWSQYGAADSIRIYKVKTTTSPHRDQHNDKLSNVASWNTGLELSTKVYGFFPLQIFNLTGIRHTFTPSISYSFVPKQDTLDRTFYNIGIPYESGHDRRQLILINLGNQLDGKVTHRSKEPGAKPTEEKFSILQFGLSTAYNFEAKKRKWSDIGLSASTSYKSLHLNYSSNFWFYDENDKLSVPIMRDMSVGVSVGTLSAKGKLWGGDLVVNDSSGSKGKTGNEMSDAQDWQISMTPAYSYSMNRSGPKDMFVPVKSCNLNASASIHFTRNWALNWSGVYDFNRNQMVQNSFLISCDLECWDMRFEWRPEKLNPGYYFLINIKKLPEIKWEKRN